MNDLIYEKSIVENEITMLEAVSEQPIDETITKEYISKVLKSHYNDFNDKKLATLSSNSCSSNFL